MKKVHTYELFRTGLQKSGNARIERIEIVNDIGQQGYALPGGRAACRKLNAMNSDEAVAYIERERREVRAGRVQD